MTRSGAALLMVIATKLDWINIGDAIHVQDAMNGLSSPTTRQNINVAQQVAECEEEFDLLAYKKGL